MKRIFHAFALAIKSIRSNFFHTLLSILGVIIGVGALVAILALIDGLQQMAYERISSQTSLESISLRLNKYQRIDGVRVEKDDFQMITYQDFQALVTELPVKDAQMIIGGTALHNVNDSVKMGLRKYAGSKPMELPLIRYGDMISDEAFDSARMEAVISYPAAIKLADSVPENALGQTIKIDNLDLKIVGVLDSSEVQGNTIAYPISLISVEDFAKSNPVISFKAENVEKVPEIEQQVKTWLDETYPDHGKNDYNIITSEKWVKELNTGFLIFRVIMGLIIGISVLVGGIGIMNVLLISVNDRIKEIGIRKATGAKKRDIVWQFLAESITISALGSFLGTLLGIGFAMVAVPIAGAFVEDIPFKAAFTTNTMLVTAFVAMAIGIIFGTYPAIRASKLDPVDAIRKE